MADTADNIVKVKSERPTNSIQDDIKKEDSTMEQDSVNTEQLIANQSAHSIEVKKETVPADSGHPQRKVRKRKRVRGKRKPKRPKLIGPTETPVTETASQLSSSDTEDDEYCLNVSNLPSNWSYIEIKNYIDSLCGPVDEIEFVQSNSRDVSGAIRLYYPTMGDCEKAKQKLENRFVEGNKLCVKIEASSSGASDTEMVSDTEFALEIPDLDIWDDDPRGLYGLKPEFLKSLNITPPLTKWVCVSNFRCDKAELRDVLEMAGHVLMCAVITVQNRYARVSYSHPLEAVQAVSMLNGQLFYGKKLSVVMDKCCSATAVLPKGLHNVGLGLGIKGQPLRNIAEHYKKYIKQKNSLINPMLFSPVNDEINTSGYVSQEKDIDEKMKEIKLQIDSQKQSLKFKNVEDASSFVVNVERRDSDSDSVESDKKSNEIKTITTVTRKALPPRMSPVTKSVTKQVQPVRQLLPASKPVGINPNFINGTPSMTVPNTQPCPPGIADLPLPRAAGPIPNQTPTHGFVGPLPVHGPRPGPRPIPGPVVGPIRGPMPGPFGPRAPVPMVPGPYVAPRPFAPLPNPNSATVRLGNLPLNTTFPHLCEKLSQCGQVMSLQLTEPGCAVVTFGNRAQAERCQQTYNRLPTENGMIEVFFV